MSILLGKLTLIQPPNNRSLEQKTVLLIRYGEI